MINKERTIALSTIGIAAVVFLLTVISSNHAFGAGAGTPGAGGNGGAGGGSGGTGGASGASGGTGGNGGGAHGGLGGLGGGVVVCLIC